MRDFHIVIMGVSGSGKSTLGRALADTLGCPFVEGDAYHPASNIAKMQAGQPLSNADRKGWIAALCQAANLGPPAVISCSALNPTVREWLETGLDDPVYYVHLRVPRDELKKRLAERSDHFFAPSLLHSQLTALDIPETALSVDGCQDVSVLIRQIVAALSRSS